MAPGFRACRGPCRSPRGNPTTNPAGAVQGRAESPAKGPAESASTAASEGATVPSHVGTPAPSRASTSALAPALLSTNELFKQFIQAYLESVKNPGQNQAEPQERLLKVRSPDLYSGESHMDCYHFCQQCEDHFDTAGATGQKRTPFATSFFRGPISYQWTQYKRQHQGERLVPITWGEFKAFLRKNLGDFRSFVDNIWSKFKCDSQYQLEEARE